MPRTTSSKVAKASGSTGTRRKSIAKSTTARSRKTKEASPLTSSPKASTNQLLGPGFFEAWEAAQAESTGKAPPSDTAWNHHCAYVSQREELVAATIRLVLEKGLVVIRAPPQVGKSTLLKLIGRHILKEYPSLEPVWIQWESRAGRCGLHYTEYLRSEASDWRRYNAERRPHNPKARLIYLIDEAQNSYGEADFWSRELKNRIAGSSPIFLMACLFGSTSRSLADMNQNAYSEAIWVDQGQRIDLRPRVTGGLSMQFTLKETEEVVQKWAYEEGYKLTGDVSKYMHEATSGHPGMMEMLLSTFRSCFSQLNSKVQPSRTWTPELCHAMISDEAAYMDVRQGPGTGVWTADAEGFCLSALLRPENRRIKFPDIVQALSQVAAKPNGLTRVDIGFDAFSFCHKMGFLHTEASTGPDPTEVTYFFASPVHRRVAYRRLLPGPDRDAAPDHRTLLQVCLNAIQGISLSAIHHRPSNRASIPESTFQDEMYSCLHRELHHVPILSEHSHSVRGRIDCYLFDKKWGIEILQSGTSAQIQEYAARFGPGGKYRKWNILDDFVVLNLCPKPQIQSLEIQDSELQPHIVQIAVDVHERLVEVYSYDMKLMASFTLGEGRHGSQTGMHNLGMTTDGSKARASEGESPLVAAPSGGNREQVRALIEALKNMSEETVLQRLAEQRENIVKYWASCDNTE